MSQRMVCSAPAQFGLRVGVTLALLLAFAAATSERADAGLLGSLTKVVQQTTTTVVQPVTQLTQPTTTSTTNPLGGLVAETTTTLSNTVDSTLGTLQVPPPVADAVNVIPAGYDPVTPLTNLLAGQQGLPSTLEQLACPPVTELMELVALAGGGVVADGITSLACIASLLEYRFYTRFKRADGSLLVREHQATLLVPTALDVDEDLLPDLIGTIRLTGLNSVGVVVDRMPGETAQLPVSVEAVLRDPTRGSLGRERIAFGYDARDDRAPGQFVASLPIDTILAPTPQFSLTIAQQQRGERIALIGAIFDGPLAARQNPAEVRLDYHRSPDNATIRARFGDDDLDAALTTNRPGFTAISGRIVDATEEQRFAANLADLPSSFGLTLNQAGGVDASLTSSARIGRIDGSFARLRNIGPEPIVLQTAVLDLEDVPVGVRLRMSGDAGEVGTTDGPLGHARVGTANGEPVFLAGERAYAYLSDDGTVQSTAVAIPGLSNATFTLGDAPQISAQLAAATPFKLRIEEPGRTLRADVLDLPSRFDIGLDLAAGSLAYDGHGDGVGRIDFSGDSDEPFFARATKLRGTIEDIPAQMTATFATGEAGGEIRVDGGAIGKVEVLASNGPEELPAGSGQGVVFRDVTGGDFVVSARILGLKRIAFATGDALSLETHTAGGPFSLVAQTDDLTADALIADLPAKATLTAALEQGRVTFSGRTEDDQPAGVDSLDLNVSSTGPLLGRADRVGAHVKDIPADLTLDMTDSGDGADIVASAPIGLIEMVAANRPIAPGDLPANGEQGAKFTDLSGGDYVIAARVRELRRLAARLGTPLTLTAETAGGPFGVRVTTDDLQGLARIEDLPAKLTASIDLAAGRLAVTSRDGDDQPQRIGRVTLDLVSAAALFGRATHVAANIEGIPSDLILDIAQDGTGARIEGNEAIDLIELVAANRAAQPDDLPAGGEQGAKFTDLTSGDYVLGARLRKLKKLSGSFSDAGVQLSTVTEGGPFGIRLTTDDLRGHARVEDLPEKLDVALDLDAGKLTVQGRTAADQPQGIDRIRLDLDSSAPLFGRATDVHALVEGIPSDVTLDLAQTGTGVNILASNPIGLIEVVANAGDIADPAPLLPAGGEQGAIYRDSGAVFQLSARVRELRQLTANLSGALSITAKTAGGPFHVIADANGIQADAQLRDLPADVVARFDAAAGTFHYEGRNATGDPVGVGLVTVNVIGAQPLFGRASHVSARIEDLAPVVDLALDADGAAPTITVDASAPISLVEFLANEDGATAFPAPLDDPAVQGAILHDRSGQPFVAALRVRSLRRVALTFADDIRVETDTAGSPFAVDIDTESIGIDARIADLPAKATLVVNLADGTISFRGRAADDTPRGIALLTIDARLGEAFLGRADRVSARIEQLPADVDLGFSQSSGTASLTASAPVQLIELFAWQSGNTKPAIAADQGALLHDVTGQPFELAARVRQLQALTLDFAGAMQLTTRTAGGLFEADVATDSLSAQATIDQLPSELSLGLDLESGNLTYQGSAPINRIYALIDSAEPVFMGATGFEAELRQVPQQFEVGLGTDAENIHVSADQPIGQIDLRAKSPNRAFPTVPGGEAGAILDSTGGELALALRVFQLKLLDVSLSPIGLEAEMEAGRRFLVDADIDQAGQTLRLDGVIDQLPSKVKLGIEDIAGGNGSRLVLDGSAPINFVRLAVEGLELLPGADEVEAEINTLPEKLSIELPETGSLARITAANAAGTPTAIGQLRLAASDGSKPLPPFVPDGAPDTAANRDRLEFDNSPTSFGVVLRLTAPKVIDVNLSPIALTLEQDGARTRPLSINATIPNSTAGQPATTVNGLFNKPSARTVLGVDLSPGQPTRLTFENAANVSSLSLNAANLGPIPAANFTLSNIPTRLSICMNTNSACRRLDRLPSALGDYSGPFRSPTQSGTAGGQNRPYPAQVSMNFDDQGTSGTSSLPGSMVTLNASLQLTAGATPITITNLRFHSLSMDLGQHPTSPTFSFLFNQVPRIYMFLDSVNLPFVMNEVKYPPTIESFKIGTDSQPAVGNRRLVWLPGTRCPAIVFGACVSPAVLDPRTSGSLACGGQRNLTIKVLGLNINLLNFLGQQILPVCSS